MGWPKGKPRPEGAGRKKGTPNVKTKEVMEILAKHNFDVIAEMIDLYRRTENEEHTVGAAVKILTEIAGYVYPKRKALEHSGEINNPFLEKSLGELEALVKEKLKK